MTSKNKVVYAIIIITKILLFLMPFLFVFYLETVITNARNNISNSINPMFEIVFNIIGLTIILLVLYLINKALTNNLNKNNITIYKLRKTIKIPIIVIYSLSMFLVVVYTMQDHLIFHPNYSYQDANYIKNNGYENFNIENKYYGWVKKSEIIDSYTVIYYGGNGESAARTLARHDSLETISYYDNFNLFIIDYPSYGLSEGKASETSLNEMALKSYDYIKELEYVSENKIVVMGFSLGTGVASYVASKRAVDKLILLAPYNNFTDTMNQFLPIFYGPLKGLVKHKFDSGKNLVNQNLEILIIYTEKDEIVKKRLTEKLINEIESSNEISKFKFNDLTHNDLPFDERILFIINVFILELN